MHSNTVTLSIAIPRGQVALASGPAEPDATEFVVRAAKGAELYGILSNPYLEQNFRTVSFEMQVTVNDDGTWSYEQDTVLIIPGQSEPFHHIDRNTMRKIGEPTPNPTALAAAKEMGSG